VADERREDVRRRPVGDADLGQHLALALAEPVVAERPDPR
jgi:hypothetical protein